jgi:hypothetical protein
MCRYALPGTSSQDHSESLINPSVMAWSLFRQIAIAVFIR